MGDRARKDVEGSRLPGQQGKDRERLEEDGPDQEQKREDREQEGFREWEAGVQADPGLDEGGAAGAQAAQGSRFRGGEERNRALQACEGPLRQVRREGRKRDGIMELVL